MRPGRLALLNLVLGAWLALSGATIAGAVLSFRAAPTSAEASTPLPGPRAARAQAMRFNGEMFRASARAQLALAVLAIVLAGWMPVPSRAALACVVAAAILAAILAFVVTPRSSVIAEARIAAMSSADPSPPPPPDEAQESRFRRLHQAYATLDLAKSALLLAAAWATARSAVARARGDASIGAGTGTPTPNR